MEYLREHSILLEMCPTSNRLTNTWTDFRTHPFRTCLEVGIPACLNTDDPGIFGNTLQGEIEIARSHMGIPESRIRESFLAARKHSFLLLPAH